jgi:hypothetical protein
MLRNSWVTGGVAIPHERTRSMALVSSLLFPSWWFTSCSIISQNILLLLPLDTQAWQFGVPKTEFVAGCFSVCLHLVLKRIILSLSGIKYWPSSPYPVTPLSYPIPQMGSVWKGFYARYDHVIGGTGEAATNKLPRGNMSGELIQRPREQCETDDVS